MERNYGIPPTPTSTTKVISTTSGPATGKPSPTQPGLIDSCTTFYKAVPGDSCWGIVNTVFHNEFTLDDFYTWNPATSPDCAGLQANVYYCVGIAGSTTTSKPTGTSGAPTSTMMTVTPTPGVVPSQDGTCAGRSGGKFTCKGSTHGSCCSVWGYWYVRSQHGCVS